MQQYDLIIIGAGPAGLAAAIYAKRALLATLILEKDLDGGKLNKTAEVENYPGFIKIKGPKLAEEMAKHARSYKIDGKNEKVIQLIKNNQGAFEVKTEKNETHYTYFSRAVIIASGTIENKLNVPGEEEFTNFGVSYCAICDGFAFRDRVVAVVGGGYSACEVALYLSEIAKKVYLIHRRKEFRVDQEIKQQVEQNPRIKLILERTVKEIVGETANQRKVTHLILNDLQELEKEKLEISALFPCIGLLPYTDFLHNLSGVCDEKNYVNVNEKCETKINGLFAIGDVVKPERIRQIVTATADGAIAAQAVIEHLRKTEKKY
ncbi:NAD(P)/FAD-dependent oxidoreductase [endosymbiont GvMRE of Glomus versiforme]|uniref:NAD(P)/FAD-dependent oxidoreductase n=1 Tax=endosymbiont GvMRE of Glomus versiforme TaxID=2039283 RepID=UPI000ECEA603|nr:FAD-dependent oxidoreductase [endosymbiont GvMRE of Glomus versiforme]RHZ37516.1 Thioredoxin reductase [endosymbiont GvMRE of Glomus versiforme]